MACRRDQGDLFEMSDAFASVRTGNPDQKNRVALSMQYQWINKLGRMPMTADRLWETEFERSVSQGVTLVDFNAPWCKPCRAQASVVRIIERAFGGSATIKMLDIDEHRNIALNLGIQSIPTIIIYKNGREINRFIGLQSTETLNDALRHAIRDETPQP
jgi:thioredoxin